LRPDESGGTTAEAASHTVDDDSRSQAQPRFALGATARGGTLNIVAAACNQLCLFAIITVMARERGGAAVGEYTLGWAFLTVVGLVALWGFQPALTRFVTVHLADRDPARVRGTIRFGLGTALGLSLVLAGLVAVLADPISALFDHRLPVSELRLVAITLPGATLRDASLSATQGWRSQRAFAFIGWIFEPILRLALTSLAIAFGWGVTGIFAAIPIGAWSAAALAVLSLRSRLRSVERVHPRVDVRDFLRFSTMSWGIVMASVGLIWADTLILGVLSSAQKVGVYNVATRLVNLAVFVIVPVNAAVAPQFAHLLHRGERGPLGHAYSTTTRWILLLSMPAFVLLLVFAKDLLHIFGDEYGAGAAVTMILAVGQLLNAGTGPCGTLLNMSGRVRMNMYNNIGVLVVNIGLNLALIPKFGITGAAVAWSVSLAVVNVARVVEVQVIFGVMPFARATLKIPLAAASAAAAAIAVRLLVGDEMAQVALGIAAGAIVYCLVLWLFGFENEDVLAARSIMGRGRPEITTS
jgi:O-antigen/teichoic acid export membrane protein